MGDTGHPPTADTLLHMTNPVDTEKVLADFLAEYDENMDKLVESEMLRWPQAKLAKSLGHDVIKLLQNRMRELGMQVTITRLDE